MITELWTVALAGGTLPARLLSPAFFSDLAQLMATDGVLVLNYFGRADGNLRAVACAMRAAGFKHLRLFQEAARTGMPLCCLQVRMLSDRRTSVTPVSSALVMQTFSAIMQHATVVAVLGPLNCSLPEWLLLTRCDSPAAYMSRTRSQWLSNSNNAQGLDKRVPAKHATWSCTLHEYQSPSDDHR